MPRLLMPVSPRQGRWRDQSPLRLRGYLDGPASLASIPPPAALREAHWNGFPGALAGVLRQRIGGSRHRVSEHRFGRGASLPGYNPGAGEGLRPFEPEKTRAPVELAGQGVAPRRM